MTEARTIPSLNQTHVTRGQQLRSLLAAWIADVERCIDYVPHSGDSSDDVLPAIDNIIADVTRSLIEGIPEPTEYDRCRDRWEEQTDIEDCIRDSEREHARSVA